MLQRTLLVNKAIEVPHGIKKDITDFFNNKI